MLQGLGLRGVAHIERLSDEAAQRGSEERGLAAAVFSPEPRGSALPASETQTSAFPEGLSLVPSVILGATRAAGACCCPLPTPPAPRTSPPRPWDPCSGEARTPPVSDARSFYFREAA